MVSASLKLKYDESLSNLLFNVNLRLYTKAENTAAAKASAAALKVVSKAKAVEIARVKAAAYAAADAAADAATKTAAKSADTVWTETILNIGQGESLVPP